MIVSAFTMKKASGKFKIILQLVFGTMVINPIYFFFAIQFSSFLFQRFLHTLNFNSSKKNWSFSFSEGDFILTYQWFDSVAFRFSKAFSKFQKEILD